MYILELCLLSVDCLCINNSQNIPIKVMLPYFKKKKLGLKEVTASIYHITESGISSTSSLVEKILPKGRGEF